MTSPLFTTLDFLEGLRNRTGQSQRVALTKTFPHSHSSSLCLQWYTYLGCFRSPSSINGAWHDDLTSGWDDGVFHSPHSADDWIENSTNFGSWAYYVDASYGVGDFESELSLPA